MKTKKIEPTKTQKAKAIILGSYILYMIDSLLDKSEHFNLTTIRLRQALQAKTKVSSVQRYIEMSNEAWATTIEEFKDENATIAIFDAVETLAFHNEEEMKMVFGNHILDHVGRFSLKQTRDGVSKEILMSSRRICKALKDNMGKVIFKNKEEL